MIKSLLRLWFAVLLILAASAILLLTDRRAVRDGGASSKSGRAASARMRSVALFQHVSQATLEEGARGVLTALAQAGYEDGRTVVFHRYCAEGDAATSNTIAREITGGENELVITLSTPSLQAIAAANRDAKRPHVFGMVSDPITAGVGISRDDPKKHPPYMVGLGTMQPVAETFQMARRLNPRLAKVGVAWNPSEANSEACTKVARKVCTGLGIELLEANVDGAAAVREAVGSLVDRGAEAIWVGGDNVVLSSIDAVIGPTRTARVPVFTSVPGCAARGALFDLGADYYRVGESIGGLAARVLDGESPAEMPILYEVPSEFWINRVALKTASEGWSFSREIDAKADVVVEPTGPVRRRPRVEVPAGPAKTKRPSHAWNIGLAAYSESSILEEALDGFRRGLRDAGLNEGRDFRIKYRNAQGDIGTLNAIFDEFSSDDTELVVTYSTPALQAGMQRIDRKPIVCAVVLDPIAAGAGRSATDHRKNVTGAYLEFPFAQMTEQVRAIVPKARKIGTLFVPGEVNSTVARERFERVLKGAGLELLSVPVNSPAEVSDAALALCESGVDVVCQISDNLSNASFPAIGRACEMAKMPLFTFSPTMVNSGAILGLGSDYAENGHDAGLVAARVIGGEDPARIPFQPTAKLRRAVNLDNARRLGIAIPEAWVKAADLVIGKPASAQ